MAQIDQIFQAGRRPETAQSPMSDEQMALFAAAQQGKEGTEQKQLLKRLLDSTPMFIENMQGMQTPSGLRELGLGGSRTSIQENPNASDGGNRALPMADGQMAMAGMSGQGLMELLSKLGPLFGGGGGGQVDPRGRFDRGGAPALGGFFTRG